MPTGLLQVRKAEGHGGSEDDLVDIVAVHGLNEDMKETWTARPGGILWLRDLMHATIPVARVLTFGYDSLASSFFNDDCGETFQKQAHNLVAWLQAERSMDGCEHRPIIFVCHGIGGIIVKRALCYSASKTSSQVSHLQSIFVSTYGILFFGTPHSRTNMATWLSLESLSGNSAADRYQPPGESLAISDQVSDIMEMISSQFAPLLERFKIHFFWEEMKTDFGNYQDFVVSEASAAPILHDTERSGIEASHSQMTKFSDPNSASYKIVVSSLKRYCREAPSAIAQRWAVAQAKLSQERSTEAFRHAGLASDVSHEQLTSTSAESINTTHNKFFQAPQETTDEFIGREDELKLLQKAFFSANVADPRRRQKRFVLYGLGGSGKTQICAKFARDNQERFLAVLTIRATSLETAKESFAKIGKLGGLESTEVSGKHWLSQLEQPWLLIIDNADNPDLDLPRLFPEGNRGHIIITTRNPDFRTYSTAGSFELKGLAEQEALHLLLQRAEVSRPWEPTTERIGKEIARTLGYLALALIQAGTSISRKICGLSDYLTFHQSYRNQRRNRRLHTVESEDDDIVYSAFDFSLNYLQIKRTVVTRDAVEILNIVGFYHFEHIRVDIFTRGVENRRIAVIGSGNNSTFERLTSALLARLQPPPILPWFLKENPETLNPYRVRRALHELHSLSLISYDGKDATFSLHPLVHAWSRDRLEPGEKALWAQIALNTITESILLPPADAAEAHGDFRRDILPHLDSCLAACPIKLTDYSSLLGRLQLSCAKLFQQTLLLTIRDQTLNAGKIGYVYAERGRFHEAKVYLRMVKDMLIQLFGFENERTMAAMLGLAGTYWGLGRLEEGIALQKIVVKARSKLYGPDSHKTLLAMDQLGRSYWLQGQYHDAIDLQELTVDRMKTTLGPDHADTLSAMDNLGVTLGSWQRYHESRQIHQKVLTMRQKTLGDMDLEILTTMNNLAMALLELKKLDEAKGLMTKVYEERKFKLGKEHPWTLWALCNLAKTNCEMGLLQEAEQMLSGGIAAGKRSLSDDHLGVLMGCGELARVYARQGRLKEAEDLLSTTVHNLEKSRGDDHPDTIYAMWKLVKIYELQGLLEVAMKICETAFERANQRLTTKHPLCRNIESDLRSLQSRLRTESSGSAVDTHSEMQQQRSILQRRHRGQRTW